MSLLSDNLRSRDIREPLSRLSTSEKAAFYALSEAPHGHSSETVRIWLCNAVSFGDHGAVFVHSSRFNHSCVPNVVFDRNERKQVLELRTVQGVAAGEELTICYNHRAGYFMAEERNQHLHHQYLFFCSCSACVQPGRALADMRCRLIPGIMAALRESTLLKDPVVCVAMLPRAIFGPSRPPRATEIREPVCWWLMIKLLEAQGIQDAELAYLCTLAAKGVRDRVIADGRVNLAKATYMVEMNGAALKLYSLFRGLHDGSIAVVQKELEDLSFLMECQSAHVMGSEPVQTSHAA